MKVVAFDTETTGLNCYSDQDHIFAFAISDTEGNTQVYRDDDDCNFRQELQNFLNDTSVAKVCHNLKFDLAMLQKYGVHIPEKTVWHDTMIMSQILNNLRMQHSLDALTYDFGGCEQETDNEVARLTKGGLTYDKVPQALMDKYQRWDVQRTIMLYLIFWPDIHADKRIEADYFNEIELIKATIDMERRGIRLDRREALEMITWLEDEVHDCYTRLFELTGERLNYNSNDQLNYLLYKKLGLPTFKRKKKSFSTDKEVLFQLREQYADSGNTKIIGVLDQLSKFRSYTGALPRIRKYLKHAEADGTIHPNINTNRAKTGRESIKDPPLQGVSKNQSLFNPYPVPMRKLFRARKGTVLYLPDYSGIEMRLIVNLSQEPEMIDIFLTGKNSHEIAAKIFYGDRFINKKETPDLYSSAKNAHFALPYGASPYKLAKTLGLSVEEGARVFRKYAQRFPLIAGLARVVSSQARKTGYTETSFGRRLRVPPDAFHAALNYNIQGTGAGILKRAQTRLHRLFKTKYHDEVRLILPIHDELIIEYPRDRLAYQVDFVREVSKVMTEFTEFKIPLESEWKMTTTTWFNAEDL